MSLMVALNRAAICKQPAAPARRIVMRLFHDNNNNDDDDYHYKHENSIRNSVFICATHADTTKFASV